MGFLRCALQLEPHYGVSRYSAPSSTVNLVGCGRRNQRRETFINTIVMRRRITRAALKLPESEKTQGGEGSVQASLGTLEVFPVEIIQQIAGFLPLSTAVALALCSHNLYSIIGSQYFKDLSTTPELGSLLQLLDRDLPDHIFCVRCLKLHQPRRPDLKERSRDAQFSQRKCFQQDVQLGTSDYYHNGFRFEQVQMAMKLHRLGQDVSGYLGALSFAENDTLGPRTLKVFEARVISDEVIVRVQHWLFVAYGQPVILPTKGLRRLPFGQVCGHLSPRIIQRFSHDLVRVLQCQIQHIDAQEPQCSECTGLRQCRFCPTEVRSDLKVFEGQGTALVITKWALCGAGLTPDDPKWRSHLRFKYYDRVTPYDFKLGSISTAFEQGQPYDFQSTLTKEAQRHLLRKIPQQP